MGKSGAIKRHGTIQCDSCGRDFPSKENDWECEHCGFDNAVAMRERGTMMMEKGTKQSMDKARERRESKP